MAESATGHPARHLMGTVLKGAVSVGLLALLLSRSDAGRLWIQLRAASPGWLGVALGLYLLAMVGATWRWALLVEAQGIAMPRRALFASYLVATFFNNFLPSNIGGDVIRIRDSGRPAQSKTLATTIILIDRALGLFALVLVAAVGASTIGGPGAAALPVPALWLWACLAIGVAVGVPMVLTPAGVGRALQPLTVLHREWVQERIGRITDALYRFRSRPSALAGCFAGALAVQVVLVVFYAAVARSLAIPVPFAHLAVLVPVSFVVQMLPVSMNGLGVREAVFSLYFARIGLPIESALLLSFLGAGVILVFSLSGAAVYLLRRS
jgi:glycosyltransferase 2 family protein